MMLPVKKNSMINMVRLILLLLMTGLLTALVYVAAAKYFAKEKKARSGPTAKVSVCGPARNADARSKEEIQ
jgi:cbb3-type cytochrome oxidase subunit 3